MNKKKLIREQLDASLQRLSPLLDVTAPPKGWIRTIRDALGMTAKQLANRLGVAQQAVARIEKEELAEVVKKAVEKGIKKEIGQLYIDRETHYRDHKFVGELIEWLSDMKKTINHTIIRSVILFILGLIALGLFVWKGH